jgi:hypothetical protein
MGIPPDRTGEEVNEGNRKVSTDGTVSNRDLKVCRGAQVIYIGLFSRHVKAILQRGGTHEAGGHWCDAHS